MTTKFEIYAPPRTSLPFLSAHIHQGRIKRCYTAKTQQDAEGAAESLKRDFEICEYNKAPDLYPFGTESPRLWLIIEQLKAQGYPIP